MRVDVRQADRKRSFGVFDNWIVGRMLKPLLTSHSFFVELCENNVFLFCRD